MSVGMARSIGYLPSKAFDQLGTEKTVYGIYYSQTNFLLPPGVHALRSLYGFSLHAPVPQVHAVRGCRRPRIRGKRLCEQQLRQRAEGEHRAVPVLADRRAAERGALQRVAPHVSRWGPLKQLYSDLSSVIFAETSSKIAARPPAPPMA